MTDICASLQTERERKRAKRHESQFIISAKEFLFNNKKRPVYPAVHPAAEPAALHGLICRFCRSVSTCKTRRSYAVSCARYGRQWIYRARLKLITFRLRAVIHHNDLAWLRSSVFVAVFSHISSRLHPRVRVVFSPFFLFRQQAYPQPLNA